jgi:hypothetical protein
MAAPLVEREVVSVLASSGRPMSVEELMAHGGEHLRNEFMVLDAVLTKAEVGVLAFDGQLDRTTPIRLATWQRQ